MDRPKVYDMFDNNCLDYGPYTPSESSEASLPSAKSPNKMEIESPDKVEGASQTSTDLDMEDMLVMDEVGSSDDQDCMEPCSRTVVDVGMYSQLASAAGSDPEATRFGSEPGEPDRSHGVVKAKRGRSCPLCFETVDRPRRHVMRFHLPWFWMPVTACWQCRQQEAQKGKNAINHTLDHAGGFTDAQLHEWCQLVNGALYLLATWLECDTLDDLLRHVKDNELYQGVRSSFSKDDLPLLRFYTQHYSDNQPTSFMVTPPNHVICILNWELVSTLLSRVGHSRYRRFRKSSKRLTSCGLNVIEQDGEEENERLSLIDTHFHLDVILKRGKFDDYQHLHRIVNQFNESTVLYFGVVIYVFPDNWTDWHSQVADHMHLHPSFGIHPHIAANGVNRQQLNQLRDLLRNPRCVALGEIGLDDTTRCRCRPCVDPRRCRARIRRNQEEALVEMLFLAKEVELPVILHVRDSNTSEASSRALAIIRETQSTGLKIHRHSFVGTYEEIQEWRTLPHVKFGISWKTCEDASDSIPRLATSEILLETDAPYLSPYPECRINHPWNLDAVAQRVSEFRNLPMSILMETVNNNAIEFYGLRHAHH